MAKGRLMPTPNSILDKLKDLTDRLNQPRGEWDWDIEHDQLVWSNEVFRMFRLTPKTFHGTYSAFLDTVHPDDKEAVEKAVAAAFEGEPYSIEHRIMLPNGVIRRVHEQAQVFFDLDGNAVRMTGTVQDITNFGQNSEEEWRIYIFELLNKHTAAISALQVKAGIFSAVGSLVSLGTMLLIWHLTGK